MTSHGHYQTINMITQNEAPSPERSPLRRLCQSRSSSPPARGGTQSVRALEQKGAGDHLEGNVKDFKRKKHFEMRYPEAVERHIYFNPFNEGNEVYVKKHDVPKFSPLNTEGKKKARDKVHAYLNKQNLRLAKEIEPSSHVTGTQSSYVPE